MCALVTGVQTCALPIFATAVRMVDRVLRDAARQRALAQPAIATRLGEVLVLVVGVRHRPDRRHALRTDTALLARIEAHHHHPAIATDDQIGRASWKAREAD